jgi:hypothetical protein
LSELHSARMNAYSVRAQQHQKEDKQNEP